MTKLIGITGYKQAGKDTTAKLIASHFKNPLITSFAHPLKIAAARSLGFDRPDEELIALMDYFKTSGEITIQYSEYPHEKITDPIDRRQHDLTGREYLQFFGSEGGRNTYGLDFWVDLTLPPLTHGGLVKYSDHDVVIVPDVRFDNEAQRVHDLGGFNIEVQRPGAEGDGHVSEQGVDRLLVDYIIHNDGDKGLLLDSAATVVGDMFA